MAGIESAYKESNFAFKVDDLNIRIYRSATPESKSEERRRLVSYVHKICELGNKYMPEIQSIEQRRKERKGINAKH